MRSLAPLILVAVGCATVGCATPNPHVELPRAPDQTAPYPDRAAYMKKYYPDGLDDDHLFLHGGDRVYWPEDLGPAVDDASPTGQAIRDHLAARSEVESMAWLGNVGSVMAAVGLLGIVASPFAVFLSPSEDDGTQLLFVGIPLGTGVLLALGGFLIIGTNVLLVGEDAVKAQESADRAARTYGQSLSDRLGVSIDHDGNIVDRAAPPPPPPPPAGGTT